MRLSESEGAWEGREAFSRGSPASGAEEMALLLKCLLAFGSQPGACVCNPSTGPERIAGAHWLATLPESGT